MLTWQRWEGTPETWDALLQRFPDYTVFQSYGWGDHKRRWGWEPVRLLAVHDNQPVALAQTLVKRFPGRCILAWVPGGPVGAIDVWNHELLDALRAHTHARIFYCRISPMRRRTDEDVRCLSDGGWKPARAPLTSGLSMAYLPAIGESERIQQCSGNWGRNLRRSSKHNLRLRQWFDPDPDEILAAYVAMQNLKHLPPQITREQIVSLLGTFGDQCVLVRCDDAQGRLLALRGALTLGTKGWDTLAAATLEARKVYASHATFWELMRVCAERGVAWYDMGGIDPVRNRGVYDFKNGTGAAPLNYLGEWERASPTWLAPLAGRLVAWRSRGI